MNLEQFVHVTLVQIVNGVSAAAKELEATDAIVNPTNLLREPGGLVRAGSSLPIVQQIDFDVAVVATSDESKGGGIGVKVAWLGVDGRTSAGNSSSSESRIKFSVPLMLPQATKSRR